MNRHKMAKLKIMSTREFIEKIVNGVITPKNGKCVSSVIIALTCLPYL
jgi:hypothetical protein